MKTKNLIVLLLILFLFCIGITSLVFSAYKIYEIRKIGIDVEISNSKKIGLNADTDALHFGIIPPGGAGVRSIKLVYNKDSIVSIKAEGPISKIVSVRPSGFLMKAGEEKEAFFVVSPPEDANLGNLSGIVEIRFIRP